MGQRTNTLAVVSVVGGIASYLGFVCVGALVAIICGHMARTEIRKTGEDGDGLAVVGLARGALEAGAGDAGLGLALGAAVQPAALRQRGVDRHVAVGRARVAELHAGATGEVLVFGCIATVGEVDDGGLAAVGAAGLEQGVELVVVGRADIVVVLLAEEHMAKAQPLGAFGRLQAQLQGDGVVHTRGLADRVDDGLAAHRLAVLGADGRTGGEQRVRAADLWRELVGRAAEAGDGGEAELRRREARRAIMHSVTGRDMPRSPVRAAR